RHLSRIATPRAHASRRCRQSPHAGAPSFSALRGARSWRRWGTPRRVVGGRRTRVRLPSPPCEAHARGVAGERLAALSAVAARGCFGPRVLRGGGARERV